MVVLARKVGLDFAGPPGCGCYGGNLGWKIAPIVAVFFFSEVGKLIRVLTSLPKDG